MGFLSRMFGGAAAEAPKSNGVDQKTDKPKFRDVTKDMRQAEETVGNRPETLEESRQKESEQGLSEQAERFEKITKVAEDYFDNKANKLDLEVLKKGYLGEAGFVQDKQVKNFFKEHGLDEGEVEVIRDFLKTELREETIANAKVEVSAGDAESRIRTDFSIGVEKALARFVEMASEKETLSEKREEAKEEAAVSEEKAA